MFASHKPETYETCYSSLAQSVLAIVCKIPCMWEVLFIMKLADLKILQST